MSVNSFNYSDYPNISFQEGLDQYLLNNLGSELYNGVVFNDELFIIITNSVLTNDEITNLQTLLQNYTAPPYILTFNSTDTLTMHSHYNDDTDVISDSSGNSILQVMIYNNSNNPNTVIDGLKTIVEYYCPNVQNYLNVTSGSLYIQIFDITRQIAITEKTIDISNITSSWNTLAQSGSTQSNYVLQSVLFDGLNNKTCGYDCIWSTMVKPSDSNFKVRFHSLQHLLYNQIINQNYS